MQNVFIPLLFYGLIFLLGLTIFQIENFLPVQVDEGNVCQFPPLSIEIDDDPAVFDFAHFVKAVRRNAQNS